MLLRWLPWQLIIKKAAKAYGTIDPISFLARLRRFSQPSEVQEPIELLRAGIIFHARGLINTKAIQHNLDWIWPYWVQRQFNPSDESFIPRAFSFSHINLTHRNWTAIGRTDSDHYPLVDPRGLITPFFDGWSFDFWLLLPNGESIFPSQEEQCAQTLQFDPSPAIYTRFPKNGTRLRSRCELIRTTEKGLQLNVDIQTQAPPGSKLVLAIRPYNPEGVQFIEKIQYLPESREIKINRQEGLHLPCNPEKILFSNYEKGDVLRRIETENQGNSITCKVGMATGAAVFEAGDRDYPFHFSMPLAEEKHAVKREDWEEITAHSSKLHTPDKDINFLFRAAEYTLLLFSAKDFVPGPYTYKRFWFRDACLMLHALIKLGHTERALRILNSFPEKQKKTGFFYSQQGEWDSNGQVLWIMGLWARITGEKLPSNLLRSAIRGAKWIKRKRQSNPANDSVSGLLPAGFSAEHLGPNDFYYWDDFWALGGLKEILPIVRKDGSVKDAQKIENEAKDLEKCIFHSLELVMQRMDQRIMPASPLRRMDAGAIGSLAADYPLQLMPPGDPAVVNTIDYLRENCFHDGAFFQDMIHSGQNPYLSLAIAQGLLRNRGSGHEPVVRKVADLATPTGTWPEAIHPLTSGGCMGDGHHGWAAAEWILMLRNMFIREEGNKLVLGSGIFPEWLESPQKISFGPTPTPYGDISLHFIPEDGNWHLHIKSQKTINKNICQVRVPGLKPVDLPQIDQSLRITLHET